MVNVPVRANSGMHDERLRQTQRSMKTPAIYHNNVTYQQQQTSGGMTAATAWRHRSVMIMYLPRKQHTCICLCGCKANLLSSFILLRPHCLGFFFTQRLVAFPFRVGLLFRVPNAMPFYLCSIIFHAFMFSVWSTLPLLWTLALPRACNHAEKQPCESLCAACRSFCGRGIFSEAKAHIGTEK